MILLGTFYQLIWQNGPNLNFWNTRTENWLINIFHFLSGFLSLAEFLTAQKRSGSEIKLELQMRRTALGLPQYSQHKFGIETICRNLRLRQRTGGCCQNISGTDPGCRLNTEHNPPPSVIAVCRETAKGWIMSDQSSEAFFCLGYDRRRKLFPTIFSIKF